MNMLICLNLFPFSLCPPIFPFQRSFYRYPGGEPLLKEITVMIEAESRIGILGRNGVGKSTLIGMLMVRLFLQT